MVFFGKQKQIFGQQIRFGQQNLVAMYFFLLSRTLSKNAQGFLRGFQWFRASIPGQEFKNAQGFLRFSIDPGQACGMYQKRNYFWSAKMVFGQQILVLVSKNLLLVQQKQFFGQQTGFGQQTRFWSATWSAKVCSGSFSGQQNLALLWFLVSKKQSFGQQICVLVSKFWVWSARFCCLVSKSNLLLHFYFACAEFCIGGVDNT